MFFYLQCIPYGNDKAMLINSIAYISMSLLIKNIGELFDGYGVIKNTSIYIEGGKVCSVGKEERADEVIDAKGNFVMPGFVDSHTHTIFSGSREFEIQWKAEGMSYMEIAERGGGIGYSVNETRKASKEKLRRETEERLMEMLSHGTTTVEIKSGYGLDKENEIKMLEVINEMKGRVSMDIVPTYLAHAIPPGREEKEYVDKIINEILPEVGERNLAKFCDVFCEKGYFGVEESRKILVEGKKYGMLPKIHADEFSCIGCSSMAAEIKAVSADHLLMAGENEIEALARAGVIATLLPATPFVLNTPYPDAKRMMEKGLTVAVATDFNPNCYVMDMKFIIQLACYKMGMKPLDALKAATINGARALKMEDEVGSIEPGKKADIIITNVPSHLFMFYKMGVNMVDKVIKEGRVVYSKE